MKALSNPTTRKHRFSQCSLAFGLGLMTWASARESSDPRTTLMVERSIGGRAREVVALAARGI